MKPSLLPALVVGFTTLGLGCASARDRPPRPQPPPSPATISQLGYDEVVNVGGQYVANRAPGAKLHEAKEIWPNMWRLRYALGQNGRALDVYFDGARKEVIRTEEVHDVTARLSPVQ